MRITETETLIIDELLSLLSGKKISDIINYETDNIYNKSATSVIIKKYINNNSMYNINVLLDNNIRVKFISVDVNYKCYEALSFSNTSLYNMIFEDWDSQDILEQPKFRKELNFNYLFIPIVKIKKRGTYNNHLEWFIGDFSFWKPDSKELILIGEEWLLNKKIIQEGVKIDRVKFGKTFRNNNNLLKQSQTNFIHLRPHGKNGFDYDVEYLNYTKGAVSITKQSFWLNKSYINLLINNNKWKINSKEG